LSNTSSFITHTRMAGASHCTRTHGCGLVPAPTGIWNKQPAMVDVAEIVATGCPLTLTRVLLDMVVICPV
jgi:hypothetical protein